MLVTVATTSVFVELTRIDVLDRNFYPPERVQSPLETALRLRVDVFVTAACLLLLALLVVLRYGKALLA